MTPSPGCALATILLTLSGCSGGDASTPLPETNAAGSAGASGASGAGAGGAGAAGTGGGGAGTSGGAAGSAGSGAVAGAGGAAAGAGGAAGTGGGSGSAGTGGGADKGGAGTGGGAGKGGTGGAAGTGGTGGGAGKGGTGGAGTGGTGGAGGTCATTFGKSITPTFGRIDGTVIAVVTPTTPACGHDDNHVIVQVKMNDAAYKLWVNVGFAGTPEVAMAERDGPLGGVPFAEGWHPGVSLGYVDTFGVHSTDFTLMSQEELSAALTAKLVVGAPIAVYATGYPSGDGAHDIHYYQPDHDGALVLDPGGKPHFLLFRFSNNVFLGTATRARPTRHLHARGALV